MTSINRTTLKLERLELEHLRKLATSQREEIERLQHQLQMEQLSAELWSEQALQLQEALYDDKFTTHRAIGINKAGETMVIAL